MPVVFFSVKTTIRRANSPMKNLENEDLERIPEK
jgi:hypothetical protein